MLGLGGPVKRVEEPVGGAPPRWEGQAPCKPGPPSPSSVYWDYAMTIRLEEIVYLHCHQQGRDRG